jgi:hypothetical protein
MSSWLKKAGKSLLSVHLISDITSPQEIKEFRKMMEGLSEDADPTPDAECFSKLSEKYDVESLLKYNLEVIVSKLVKFYLDWISSNLENIDFLTNRISFLQKSLSAYSLQCGTVPNYFSLIKLIMNSNNPQILEVSSSLVTCSFETPGLYEELLSGSNLVDFWVSCFINNNSLNLFFGSMIIGSLVKISYTSIETLHPFHTIILPYILQDQILEESLINAYTFIALTLRHIPETDFL